MHTRRTIVLVVTAALAAAGALATVLVTAGGPVGRWGLLVGVVVALNGYRLWVGPWHRRWGSTGDEARSVLPGDELLPADAPQTDRAITIDAPPDEVWPWLAQVGWGRAGWYSYDWIDNDGRSSLDHVDPALAHLAAGDVIPMTPDQGFVVRSAVPGELLLAQAPDGTTWCVRLTARRGDRTRLLSRFRTPRPRSAGALAWMALADPGAFLMERRMLLNLRARAEGGVDGGAVGPRDEEVRR